MKPLSRLMLWICLPTIGAVSDAGAQAAYKTARTTEFAQGDPQCIALHRLERGLASAEHSKSGVKQTRRMIEATQERLEFLRSDAGAQAGSEEQRQITDMIESHTRLTEDLRARLEAYRACNMIDADSHPIYGVLHREWRRIAGWEDSFS